MIRSKLFPCARVLAWTAHLTFATVGLLLATTPRVQAQTWANHALFPGYPRTLVLDPASPDSPPTALVGGNKSSLSGVVSVGSDGTATVVPGSGPDGCYAMTFASSGILYAAGNTGSWSVHESPDGGNSWSSGPVDAFALSSQFSCARGVAADGQGNVFVCGGAIDAGGYAHWIVRRRDAAGSWRLVQDYSLKGKDCYAAKLCVVGDTLIVVGRAADKWTVQRGRNLGAATITWDAPYTWAPAKTTATGANAVAVDAAGNLYVAGIIGTEKFGYGPTAKSCVIQKSTDGGATWVVLATLAATNADLVQVGDLAIDAAGDVFLAGAASFSYSPKPRTVVSAWKWLVFQRDATSGAWTQYLPFGSDPSTGASLARGLAADASGNVLVTGPVTDASGAQVAVVQRFVPN